MSTMFDLRQFVTSKVNKNDTPENIEMCAGLGLMGEIGEFSDLIKKEDYHGKPCTREKKLDELGDILFYFQNYGGLSGTELDEIYGRFTELNDLLDKLPLGIRRTLSRATNEKKWRFMCCLYMASFAVKLIECNEESIGERWYREPAMRHAFGYFTAMVYELGFTLEEVFQANVRKLNVRYPNGFEPGRAHAQGEEGERTYSPEAAKLVRPTAPPAPPPKKA